MKINELIKTKQFECPRGVTATLREDISWYDFTKAMQIPDEDERGLAILSKMVTAWNIEGDDGNPLPITPENLGRLPADVGAALTAEASAILEALGKKKVTS